MAEATELHYGSRCAMGVSYMKIAEALAELDSILRNVEQPAEDVAIMKDARRGLAATLNVMEEYRPEDDPWAVFPRSLKKPLLKPPTSPTAEQWSTIAQQAEEIGTLRARLALAEGRGS